MHQGEAGRSGYLNTSYSTPLRRVRSITLPASLLAEPIKVGEKLIVGATDGKLRAYNVFTGSLLWEKALGGTIESTPAYAEGVVVAATKEGKLYGLSLSGNQLWMLDLSEQVVSPLLVWEGQVYVGSGSGFLYRVDLKRGALTNQFYVGNNVNAGASAKGNLLVVGAPLGRVFGLGYALSQTWQAQLPNGIFYRATAAFDDEGIFVAPGDYDKNLYKFDTSGNIVWQRTDIEPSVSLLKVSSVAKRQNLVALHAGAPSTTAKLYVFDASTGSIQWSHNTGNTRDHNLLPAPIFLGDKLSVADTDGRLWVLSPSGGVLQQEALGAPATGLVASSGLLIASLQNGSLLVYETTPATLPVARISSPTNGSVAGQSVTVSGSAFSDYFKQYEVLVGQGSAPTSFTSLGTFYEPVQGGVLYTWDASSQSEGTYLLKLIASDIAGNQASAQVEVVLDLTPPLLSVLAPAEGSSFNTSQVTVSGTTDADATVTVNGQSTAVSEEGSFSQTLSLSDGAQTITVQAKDPYGNSATKTIHITVDTTPPALTLTQPASTTVLTSSATLPVSGTTEPGAAVTVRGSAVSAGSDGSFSTSLTLSEGTHTVEVVASDALGNQQKVSLSVTVDLTPPPLSVSEPAEGLVTNQSKLSVKGSTEAGAAVSVQGASAAVDPAGNFLHELTLDDGTHTLSVVATDPAGNQKAVQRSVTVKTAGPDLRVVSPAEGLLTNQKTLTVSGTTEAGATVTVQGSQVSVGSDGSFSTTRTLSEGGNLVEVKATDVAGNSRTIQRTVTLDTVNPTLALSEPQENLLTNNKEVRVSGTVEVGARLFVQQSEETPNADGTFSVLLTLPEGLHTVEVKAEDAATNQTLLTRKVTVDTTPPEVAILAPGGVWQTSSTVLLEGSTEADLTVTVGAEATTSDADGTFSLSLSLQEGENPLTVRVTDKAGNVGEKQIVVKVDTIPPLVVSASLNDFTGFVLQPEVELRAKGTDGEKGSGIVQLLVGTTADFGEGSLVVQTDGRQDYATVTLPEGDGQKKVYLRYQDLAGHLSEVQELTTILDTRSFLAKPVDPDQGGEFATADGTKVVLPAKALRLSKELRGQLFLVILNPELDAQKARELPKLKDELLEPAGSVRDIFFAGEQGEVVSVELTQPVALTLPFEPDKLEKAKVEAMRVFTFDETLKDWQILEGTQKVSGSFVEAKASHFSLFRAMGVVTVGDDFVSELFNFPNPFSTKAGTTVSYRLKGDAQRVSLEVYTVRGDKIRTESFLAGEKGALIGLNQVKFSGTHLGRPLANGVYLYRLRGADLQGNSFQKLGKMVVLR